MQTALFARFLDLLDKEYNLQLADRAMDEQHLDRSRVIEELRLHTDYDEQLEDDVLVAALAAFLLEHPFER